MVGRPVQRKHPPEQPQNFLDLFVDAIAEKVAAKLGHSQAPDVLSPRTIAKRLDCSQSEVRRWLQLHRMPTLRFGRRGYRVPRDEFEKRYQRWRAGGELWD